MRIAAPAFAGCLGEREGVFYDGVFSHQENHMPVNVSTASHGVLPAVVPAQEPPSPRGRSGVVPQGGSAAELPSRKAPGGESARPVGAGTLPGLPKTVSAITNDPRIALGTVRQMPCESLKDSPDALNAAFRLPPSERSELTTHLAGMLDVAATPEARLAVASHLFDAAQGLESRGRAEMLALIAARIDQMPAGVQADVFSQITQDVMTKLGKADMLAPLQALAGQLEAFPVERRFNVMAVLAFQNRNSPNAELRSLSLDPPAQAQLLAKLPEGIPSMGEGLRLKAFQLLVGDVLNALPANEIRLPALKALSRQVRELPPDEQAGSLWQLRCEIKQVSTDPLFADRLALEVSRDLPLPDHHRAALLSAIIDQSAALPEAHRSALHRDVHQMVLSAQLF